MKEYYAFPQSFIIIGASPSDCLMSYTRHSWGWVLPLYRDAVGVFYSHGRLGFIWVSNNSLLTVSWISRNNSLLMEEIFIHYLSILFTLYYLHRFEISFFLKLMIYLWIWLVKKFYFRGKDLKLFWILILQIF